MRIITFARGADDGSYKLSDEVHSKEGRPVVVYPVDNQTFNVRAVLKDTDITSVVLL